MGNGIVDWFGPNIPYNFDNQARFFRPFLTHRTDCSQFELSISLLIMATKARTCKGNPDNKSRLI